MLVVEQELRQRSCQLGLSDTGRPRKYEAAHGTLRIFQSAARAHDCVGHRFDCFVLADHALMQLFRKMHQLLNLAFQQFRKWNASPAG
jgi:hypothetical protein